MKTLFLLFTIFLFLSLNGSAQAGTYYVAKTGDDANPGSEAQPWLSIQKAADTLVAGDTVYIRAGTYKERVIPKNSGSAGNYITYAAYPGETVTIDGTGVDLPEWTGLFDITGKAYIKVSGLRVTNARVNPHNLGIQAETSSHVIIEKNYVYNTNDSGIGIWSSSDVTVDHNEVEKPCQAGWNESLSVGGTDGFDVKNNLVHDSPKEGICTKDGSSNGKVFGNEVHHTAAVGIYVDAWDKHTYNIDVFQNVVHDISNNNGFAVASEMGGLLENIRIYNNVAYHNRFCGVSISINGPGDAQGKHWMKNIQVINNTFYNNGWTTWGGGITIDNPDAQNVVVRNNIASQNLYFQIAVGPGVPAQNFTVDHNLIDGYLGTEGEIYGNDYVEGDPKFINASVANFHLQEGSPAIDAGSSDNAPSFDFDGKSRPYGKGYDIGAYEYGATPPEWDEIMGTGGTWSSGIWYYNLATKTWSKPLGYTPSGPIAVGDVTGDGKADMVSCWPSGLWYQNGDTLAWTNVWSVAPSQVAVGDITGDGRAEIIGTWGSGIWYWNPATSGWTQMYNSVPSGPIAAGEVTGDGRADVVSCWPSGLWYQNGATLGWTKVWSVAPSQVAVGDITGDGRAEIIGTWSTGIWYWNPVTSLWTKMTSYVPTGPIAAGDVTGDGRADVVSCWPSGLWYQDGATLGWTKVYSTAPSKIAVGNITGN